MAFMRDTVDALCGRLKELSCHQSGTRIVQCVLKHFPDHSRDKLVRGFLGCFDDLVRNGYGTYVLQDALKLGNEDFTDRVRSMVEAQLLELCMDQHGSFFLESFLETSSFRELLLSRILKSDQILKLLNNSSANFVLKKVMELSDNEQLKGLEKYVEDNRDIIARQQFGADFLTFLQERIAKGPGKVIAKAPRRFPLQEGRGEGGRDGGAPGGPREGREGRTNGQQNKRRRTTSSRSPSPFGRPPHGQQQRGGYSSYPPAANPPHYYY